MGSTNSRRHRRKYELQLKKTNPVAYKEWKENNKDYGKQLHNENIKEIKKQEEETLLNIENKISERLANEGKGIDEINKHIEDWLSKTKIWGED